MTKIELSGITKVYSGEVRAVSGVSFEVAAGECLVILGPSGAGKSTLLRIIAGLERADEGELRFDGRSMLGVPARSREVGFVFQSPALFPHLKVRDNVAFGLRARRVGTAEIGRAVFETAERLGIGALLDRYPGELSGGEARRVSLARAIAKRPRVLLLDEPFGGLDPPLRIETRELLSDLRRELGVTTIAVSHDQADAAAMADRVAVVRRGELRQFGKYVDLHDDPADRFVAGFVGDPPRCFVSGTVREHDGAFRFEAGEGLDPIRVPAFRSPVEVGTRWELGMRHDEISTDGSDRGVGLVGTVSRVEPRGSGSLLTINGGFGAVRALLPRSREIAVGSRISFRLDVARAVWFRPADGARVR